MNANNTTQHQPAIAIATKTDTVNQHQSNKNCWDHFGRNKVSVVFFSSISTIHFKYGDWARISTSSFNILFVKLCVASVVIIIILSSLSEWECESVKIIVSNACILPFFLNSYSMLWSAILFFFLVTVDVIKIERESKKTAT